MLISIYAKAIRRLRGRVVTDSEVHPTAKAEPGSKLVDTKMGRHSFCGYDCTLLHAEVGSFCSIASNVSVGGATHPISFTSTSPVFLSHKDSVRAKFAHHVYNPILRTRIGNDVWIGEGAYIKAGVTIGDGAIVGMAAVVTKDVEPYAIVGGNPAKVLRMRFEKKVVEGLMRMQWWNLPDDELRRIGPLIPNPEELLRQEGYL